MLMDFSWNVENKVWNALWHVYKQAVFLARGGDE
jgi:hypothetical protein